MNMFKTISRLRVTSVLQLLWLCVPNFLLLWPTYKATKECMSISTHHFGRKHYQNGQANAFRHALWNILIATKSHKLNQSVEKILKWTKSITDWHEQAFFSKKLPMKMDYHNNAVGRKLFEENFEWSHDEFIKKLLLLTAEAIKIKEFTDLNLLKNQLVYISDDH